MRNDDFSMAELYPLICEVIGAGGEFRLYPRGTSMLPLLRQGVDSVALSHKEKPAMHDICLYQRKNGQFVLHRLVGWDRDGFPVFCGDHQIAKEYGVPLSAVIACAVAVYRGEHRIENGSFRDRLYRFFHLPSVFRCFRYGVGCIRRRIGRIFKESK